MAAPQAPAMAAQRIPTPDELVPDIRRLLDVAEGSYREAGRLLALAKTQLPHGAWGLWLEEHFALTARTARRYMELAAFKVDTMSDLKALKAAVRVTETPTHAADATERAERIERAALRG